MPSSVIGPIGGGGASAINDLTDVDTATVAPAVNESLTWDGTNWVPQAATPPGVIGFEGTANLNQNIPLNTSVQVLFSATQYNALNMFNAPTGVVTMPVRGYCEVTCVLRIPADIEIRTEVFWERNGIYQKSNFMTTHASGINNGSNTIQITAFDEFLAGDTLAFFVRNTNNAGVAINLTGVQYIYGHYLGPKV